VTVSSTKSAGAERSDAPLSFYQLLDPEVLANPYPLFHPWWREDPVHWDGFLHAWVATRHTDQFRNLRLEPQSLTWRTNLDLCGLTALHLSFGNETRAAGSRRGLNETASGFPGGFEN
jgi:hypothetical protein